MKDILYSIWRSGAAFMILIIITYFIGKQINAHKNYLNFALSITLGSLIANLGFDINIKFLPILFAFATMSLIYFISSYLAFKSRHFRVWFSGKPTIIIENGQLNMENMRKIKYSVDTLDQQLRESGVFRKDEIEFAQLEVSGNLSIIKRDPFKPVVIKDLKRPVELVTNGQLNINKLTPPYTLEWLNDECLKRGILLADVHDAVVSSDGRLIIDVFSLNSRTMD